MSANKDFKRITTHALHQMKARGEKISMLTAYDFSFARIIDQSGIDVILVGDSASNVMAGHETTLPITLLGVVLSVFCLCSVRAVCCMQWFVFCTHVLRWSSCYIVVSK